MIISDLINYSLPVLKPSDSVAKALDWMHENRIGALVVVDFDTYLGIVTEDLLLDFDENDTISSIPLVFSETFLFDTQHIFEALHLISKYQMQVIAILNHEQKFEGMVTVQQVYERFANLLGVQETGSVIVIQLANKHYSLAEISRLIEGENAKILSCYFSGNLYDDENPAHMTIKIDRTEISTIVATLERFGYIIESAHAHETIESLEQERYDLLMRYLSV